MLYHMCGAATEQPRRRTSSQHKYIHSALPGTTFAGDSLQLALSAFTCVEVCRTLLEFLSFNHCFSAFFFLGGRGHFAIVNDACVSFSVQLSAFFFSPFCWLSYARFFCCSFFGDQVLCIKTHSYSLCPFWLCCRTFCSTVAKRFFLVKAAQYPLFGALLATIPHRIWTA